MKLYEFLKSDAIHVNVVTDSKKNVFKILGNLFSPQDSSFSSKIIDKLNERERLGPTTIGKGVAIPHTKIDGLKQTKVIFLKLKNSVDFSASDNQKIDLIFSIVAPEDSESDHLLILSSISKFIRKTNNINKLRKLKTASEIFLLFKKG